MYFVWEKDFGLTSKFAYFDKTPDNYDTDVWLSGDWISGEPQHLTLLMNDERPTALSDVLLTGSDIHVVSPRVVGVFRALEVNNIQYVPVTIIDYETKAKITDYNTAHILGSIRCLDVENSDCRYSEDGEDLMAVENFAIFEDRIPMVPKTQSRLKIFRLGEFPFLVLVHESIKEAFEGQGFTGIEFIDPAEYF